MPTHKAPNHSTLRKLFGATDDDVAGDIREDGPKQEKCPMHLALASNKKRCQSEVLLEEFPATDVSPKLCVNSWLRLFQTLFGATPARSSQLVGPKDDSPVFSAVRRSMTCGKADFRHA